MKQKEQSSVPAVAVKFQVAMVGNTVTTVKLLSDHRFVSAVLNMAFAGVNRELFNSTLLLPCPE